MPVDPVIEVGGPAVDPFAVRLPDLRTLSRCEIDADFHCVAGWSATGLRWEGVALKTFYSALIEPALLPGAPVTHLVFEGLDRYRSYVQIEDALADDVLLAENLDGRPLDADHGAPIRVVSPAQYGYVNTKHLCRIEVHTTEPAQRYSPSRLLRVGLNLVKPHPRARVWEEERHRYLPPAMLRRVYPLLIPVIRHLSARGSRKGAPTG